MKERGALKGIALAISAVFVVASCSFVDIPGRSSSSVVLESSSSSSVAVGAFTPVGALSELTDGDFYMIASSLSSGRVIGSGSSDSYYLQSQIASFSGTGLLGADSLEEFVLGGSVAARTFRTTKYKTGQYLGSKSAYPSDLIVSSSADEWSVAEFGDGLFTVKNAVTGYYIGYDAVNYDWRCFAAPRTLALYRHDPKAIEGKKAYRVEPKTAESGSSSLGVYSVALSGGSYVSTLTKILTEGTYYTDREDVAAYWIGFGELPANYVNADGDHSSSCQDTKDKGYEIYGESTRLWFTYHRDDGYMTQVPEYNPDGSKPTYYEIDIASSWSSYYGSRGALRLVGMPYGLVQYGADPVIFYTSDHYGTFSEYYNYSGGWGAVFADRSDYVKPTTVGVSY
ncbi:MAG: hypothetical protein LKK13_03190 [Bacilli bacterium]|nr:hypothetical protein [Bacilli bacterium]